MLLWVAESALLQLSPHDIADRPHLANQLGRDRHLRDVLPLAGLGQGPVAVDVARVAKARLGHDGGADLGAAVGVQLVEHGVGQDAPVPAVLLEVVDRLSSAPSAVSTSDDAPPGVLARRRVALLP